MKTKLKAGSRSSPLAKIQVEEVFSLLSEAGVKLDYELTTYETGGDKDQITSLTSNPADDFFTDTLDAALLNKEIDVTIHSAKDLPQKMREGLIVAALTRAIDDTDALVGNARFSELKPGAKIGTSSLVRQQEIKKLRADLETVDIRGSIQKRIELLKQGKYDGIIVATCALKRLGLENEITDIFPWEAAPLQGQLAVVVREDDRELKKAFAAIDVRKNYGKVSLVGAGPGDPDLITIKGINALKKCDCIFYDYLAHKDLLDYAPHAEKVYAGKRKGEHVMPQAELSRKLKERAMAGKNVVRLKGGDPFLFGRGADEQEYLRAFHIKVEAIPGVSSATAIPADLGIPLTARGVASSVAFVSAHGEAEGDRAPEEIKIPQTDTIVFLMGLSRLDIIVRSLLKAGWKKSTPIIVVSKGTRVDEKVVGATLADIQEKVAEAKLTPPALIVAGEVVKFRREDPRKKENILYLGTHPEKYKSLGRIIHHPMIAISPAPMDENTARQLLKELQQSDIVLLTSRFAVKYLFEILRNPPESRFGGTRPPLVKGGKEAGIDSPPLKKGGWGDLLRGGPAPTFAVIGQDTAFALQQHGIAPDIVAEEETSVGMFACLKEAVDLKGKKILFPRSSLSNPYLKRELTKAGACVTEVTIYQNTKPEKRDLPDVPVNKVLFTSPSTVKNFLEDYGAIPGEWQILSKGPRTEESLKEAGYKSEIFVFD